MLHTKKTPGSASRSSGQKARRQQRHDRARQRRSAQSAGAGAQLRRRPVVEPGCVPVVQPGIRPRSPESLSAEYGPR